jgi:hypothetical protein
MLIAIPSKNMLRHDLQGRNFNQFAAVARDLLKSAPL